MTTWRDRLGKEVGDTWMPMGDSCCGMGKTITVLKKKKKLKKKEILLQYGEGYNFIKDEQERLIENSKVILPTGMGYSTKGIY